MNRILVKNNSIFSKITSNFDISATFPFIPKLDIFKYEDIIRLVNNYKSAQNQSKIMADNFMINEKEVLFLLNIDKQILIIDEINFEKCKSLFKSMQSSFFFPNDQIKDEFNFFFEKKSSFTSKDELFSFSKSDISLIQTKIINFLIMRSQIMTQQRHQNIESISIDINTKYKIEDFVGIKIFHSNVQLCYNLNDQFLYILKTFDTNDYESNKYYERELTFYKAINNKNRFICKFFGTIQDQQKKSIVIEYIEGETLENFLLYSNKKNSPLLKMKFILQILMTTEFIHLNDLVLRDLKSDNILIDSNQNAIFIDFDRAREMIEEEDNSQQQTITNNFGCEYFQAPEQFLNGEYSFKSDIYTIGIIFYFILNEKLFDDTVNISFLDDLYHSKKTILNEKSIFYFTKEFEFLFSSIKKCLEFDCEKRPNITELFYSILYNINLNYKEKISKITTDLYTIRTEQLKQFFGVFEFHQNELSCDVEKFIKFLNIASNSNDSYAQFFLGRMYYKGKYLPFDLNKFKYYMKLSFNQRNSYAQYFLASLYLEGEYVEKNLNVALNYYNLSANQGNLDAIYVLGLIYFDGKHVLKDIKKGLNYIKYSADHGLTIAQKYLGFLFYENIDLKRDINLSIYYLTLAADKRDGDACLFLSKIYLEGYFIKVDFNKAVHYLEIAAEQKITKALVMLGSLYSNELYIKKDITKSFHYLTLASNMNSPEASYLLALQYFGGYIVKRDIYKAINYFKHAANGGIHDAEYYLGEIYFNGKHIQIDIDQSLYYSKLASDHGINKANLILGYIYYKKEFNKFNINKSIHYLALASKDFPKSNTLLGSIYYNGIYVVRDIKKSIYYWKRAADQNEEYANFYLGEIYYLGNYVKKDIKKAIQYLLKSDLSNSQYYLGCIYYTNGDIKKGIYYLSLAATRSNDGAQLYLGKIYCVRDDLYDIDKSIYYFQLAANRGNTLAQYNLGLIYYVEKYKRKDIKKAFYYFNIAADKNKNAAFYLGNFYFNGEFVMCDIQKAISYYKNSSSMGNCNAKNNLGVIYLRKEEYGNAIVYFKEAIKRENNCLSLYNLARMYYFGMGVDKNVDKAIELLEIANNKNFYLALFVLFSLTYDQNEKNIKAKYEMYSNMLKDMENDIFKFLLKLCKHSNPILHFFEFFDLVSPFSYKNFNEFYSFLHKESDNCKNASSNIQHLTDQFYEGFDIKFE